MRTLLNGLMLLGTVLFFTSCGESELTAKNGLKYKLLQAGDGDFAKNGDYLLVNMQYKDQNDSIWFSNSDIGYPQPLVKDSTWQSSPEGSIYPVLADLKQGDSVEFSITSRDFYSKTVRSPMPPQVDSTAVLTFNLGVENVFDQQGFMAWRQQQQQRSIAKQQEQAIKQKEEDLATIATYLEENNIKAQTTETGLSYVITEEGEGERATSGSLLRVNYIGNVLNGGIFDTNNEEMAKEKGLFDKNRTYGPFEFKLGAGGVIKGWDEGFALLKQGSKATFYIPSGLAYGPRQRSAVILPNSILVFDVELVEIVK
ncbi:MAG: FKBP-type peptidyl-prolyl cis-trans isomerase [Bacteroidota bacterium]